MEEKINILKTQTKWAFWAGSYFHPPNTHNCASIVLDVLYAGGLGWLTVSTNDLLGIAGSLLGAGYFAFMGSKDWLSALVNIAVGFVVGRGFGGAYDGYNQIQSFLNTVASQGRDNMGTVLGLRLAGTLLPMLIGIVKPGRVVSAYMTLPQDVVSLAHQAEVEERAKYSFRIPKKIAYQ